MKWLVNGAYFVGVMMVFQSCMAVGNFLGLTSEAEKSKPDAVVLTAEEQKANDALWEAKQAEIAAKQKADAEAAKYNTCTTIDQDGIKTVNLVAAQEALSLCPWNTETVNAQIDIQNFSDTLQKHTPGIFASEAMNILAPEIYKQRDVMYAAINGVPIDQGEYMVFQTLKQQSVSNGLGWDDEMIANLSKGIVAGLYDWNN